MAGQAASLRSTFQPFQREDDAPIASPVPYPDGGDDRFPLRLAALAEYLAAGLPIRIAALTAPGRYDTHDDQAEPLARGLRADRGQPAGVPARPRGARARRPRRRPRVERVQPPPEENGSGGTDHGAAGLGLVLGTRADRPTWSASSPGLDQLDGLANLRATSDFRGLYSSLAADWFGVDPGAVFGSGARVARPRLVR